MIVVTTDSLPGYRVERVLGPVLGTVAATRNAFESGMKAQYGEPKPDRAGALFRDRAQAIRQMMAAASQQGATAIIGMRFDHREVSNAWMEICAYGTAVVASLERV